MLVPDTGIAPAVRRALLKNSQHYSALLGPEIVSLQAWVNQSNTGEHTVPGALARELMFVEAIREHTRLFGDEDPWRLSESLLALFDELTLNHIELPDNQQAFLDYLREAYGLSDISPDGLSREAQIIHTLWHAWHEQLDAEQQLEPAAAYIFNLKLSLQNSIEGKFFYLLGHHDLTEAEWQWFHGMASERRIAWITYAAPLDGQGQPVPRSDFSAENAEIGSLADTARTAIGTFLDGVYSGPTPDLATRANAVARNFPQSPALDCIEILGAEDAEREAQAVDLQIRRWLVADSRATVGVVTEDRRLARRIRALLERAGIVLQDNSGWALSTTSAAAALERWLETVEENFAWRPLLDVLKSPFVFPDQTTDARLATVYRLEQDVILHEHIARGLDRYRRHIDYRNRRLPWSSEEIPTQLHALLDCLDASAEPLRAIIKGTHPARLLLAQLRESMERLGLWTAMEKDAAGQRVLQVWEDLNAASRHCPLSLNWVEFRSWLGRALERHNFRPARRPAQVQLLSLVQSRLHRFDALVVAGCDQPHLPGPAPSRPWFNDSVRRELGLPVREDRLRTQLHDFRGLLESAPRVLLTWHREDAGEPVLPSPWLELQNSFHEFAYGSTLEATALQTLLGKPGTQVTSGFPLDLPAVTVQPRPHTPPDLRPTIMSASTYQQLVDCPYQFYAARCLGLQAPEAVREALQKSDYGERVHQCLQAFHGNVEYLPGPFGEQISDANRDAAIDMLGEISRKVFARDLEDNFEHRGWLKRWFTRIPEYIDWEIARETDWKVNAVESTGEHTLHTGFNLKGRLDRIDKSGTRLAVVDYKTGNAPGQEEVEHGEAVQLAVYAALTDRVPSRIEYLLLDHAPVKSGAMLEGDELVTLYQQNLERLENILNEMDSSAELPAWGDVKTCSYCSMDGICRKQAWLTE